MTVDVLADLESYYEQNRNSPRIVQKLENRIKIHDWEKFDEETWKKLVDIHPLIYTIIPKKDKTKELTLQTIIYHETFIWEYDLISAIPKELFDGELVTHIAENSPTSLIYFPLTFLSQTELYKLVYQKIRDACQFVLKGDFAPSWYGKIFESVPPVYRDYDFCQEALKVDPNTFRKIPLEVMTNEMVDFISQLATQKENHKLSSFYIGLRDIPVKFRTAWVCYRFYQRDIFDLRYFPVQYLTAIQNNGEPIYQQALRLNPLIVTILPKSFLTQELCDYHFQRTVQRVNTRSPSQSPFEMEDFVAGIPVRFRTKEMCDTMIKRNSTEAICNTLRIVPKEFKDRDFWHNFLSNDKSGIFRIAKYVPPEYDYLLNNLQRIHLKR